MIKKLRRRFILINMALVLLVLFALFSAICISSYRSLESDSLAAMHRTLVDFRRELRTGESTPVNRVFPDDEEFSEAWMAVSCIWIDEERNWDTVKYFLQEGFLTKDEILFAAGTAYHTGKADGILPEQKLRWKREAAQGGTVIAFVDRSNEIAVMSDLIRNTALVCAAAAIAFWLISIFLVRLMTRPVEAAWEQQRQFIADASHELKTPLTVILANTEILQAHPNETIGSQHKWVGYIAEEAQRMRQLVEDMLFLAKSDAAREKTVTGQFDASDLLMSCLLLMEPLAFERGILIESDIEPEIILDGDNGQFRQLCMILLDNACKYTAEGGGITVQFARTLDRVRLSVYNTGTPIPKENVSHLFERFYRADSSRTREAGGYGLGLSIAEKITKNFRGKITVETDETGNTFIVSIPNRENLLENRKHK